MLALLLLTKLQSAGIPVVDGVSSVASASTQKVIGK
jgi:hypothetical protein